MGNEDNQRIIHRFLCEHFKSQEAFSKDDLFSGTSWAKASQDTYWSKQIAQFVKEDPKGVYKVGRRFGPYQSWDRFQRDIVTQNRDADITWELQSYKAVLNFEFFMPLAHEVLLIKMLDDIFYDDSLRILFATIDQGALYERFPFKDGESSHEYLQRLRAWVTEKFGGYSISHVSGRFRVGELLSREDAAKRITEGDPYLIDETTAVVRFIIPCGRGVIDHWDNDYKPPSEDVLREASDVRWLFHELFVKSMLEAVRGEKQIWMLESGLFRRLHIWGVSSEK